MVATDSNTSMGCTERCCRIGAPFLLFSFLLLSVLVLGLFASLSRSGFLPTALISSSCSRLILSSGEVFVFVMLPRMSAEAQSFERIT